MQMYQNTDFSTLCKHYIAPSVVSAVFFSVYAIIDGIIVGSYLGSDSLAAMGLVMPFMFISFALADMIAIGSSVQISLRLGRGKAQKACEIFSACVLAIVLISYVIGLALYIGMEFLLDFMSVSESIKALCVEYLEVIAIFMPIISLSYALDNYLRICQKAVYSMWVGVFVVLCNVALMCLFVIVLELGLFGVALAMCLGLSLGTILSLMPFFTQDLVLKFCYPKMKLKKFLSVLYNGSSEFMDSASGSLFAIFANATLLKLSGALGVAVYAAILYIDGLVISVIMAANGSLQPLLSYFFAKRDSAQIKHILRILIAINVAFSLFVLAILGIFRADFAGFFAKQNNAEFIAFMSLALLLYSFGYIAMWFNALINAVLTAFDKPTLSMLISLSTNLIAPLAFLMILPRFWGVEGVFVVHFFAEICVLIASVILLKKVLRF